MSEAYFPVLGIGQKTNCGEKLCTLFTTGMSSRAAINAFRIAQNEL